MDMIDTASSRRRFLKYMMASPLMAAGMREAYAQQGEQAFKIEDPMQWAPIDLGRLVSAPNQAQNIFDLEMVAHNNVPPAHWGYLTTGADGESTLRANRADFQRFALRPHRMRDVSHVDISTTLFGQKMETPIFLCPTSSNGAFHKDGDLAVSRAAGKMKHLQMLSTVSTSSIEDCIAARGSPIWFQLYASSSFEIAKALIARAEAAGAPGIAITVDVISTRKNETQARLRRLDKRNCLDCHSTFNGGTTREQKANFSKMPPDLLKNAPRSPASGDNMTWEVAKRLRDTTKMKVIIKGIVDPDDARECVKYGFDAVHVSNHGGRDDDGGWSTIRALPDIAAAVNKKIPILIDSGFRRGMDITKALAMGATAVGVGRPYLWGLGAFGQEGVERVLEILRTELTVAVGQAGCGSIKDLNPGMIKV